MIGRAGSVLGLVLGAVVLSMPSTGLAEYSSQLKVGNWSGGAWVDPASKQFRNCGAGIKFSSGTSLTVILGSTFAPAFVISDQKLQAKPREASQLQVKFDDGPPIGVPAVGLQPTMIQIQPPGFPASYEAVRKAKRFAVVAPGLSTSLDVTGLAELMPRLYECVVDERGRMALPPAVTGETTAQDRSEVFGVGLVAAERAKVGPYVVLTDKERPAAFGHALSVIGHPGVSGPDGAANVLMHAHFYPVIQGQTIDRMKEPRRANLRQACNDASFESGDLPAIAGKPSAIGIFISCRGSYEEIYILPRRNGGQIEIALSGPPQRRRTVEAVGAKYRSAFATLP